MENKSIFIESITNNRANRIELAHEIGMVEENLRSLKIEIAKYLASETSEFLSDEYYRCLSALPEKLHHVIEKFFDSIIKHGYQEQDLEDLDCLIAMIVDYKKMVLDDNMVASPLLKKLIESVDEENVDGQLFINKLEELNKSKPLVVISDKVGSYYESTFGFISIDSKKVKYESIRTLAHELGHMLHYQVLAARIPDNFESLVREARVHSVKSGKLKEVIDAFEEISILANRRAQDEALKTIKEKASEFVHLQLEFIKEGYNPVRAMKLAKEEIFLKEPAEIRSKILNDEANTEFTPQLGDIISAVFVGKKSIIFDDMPEEFISLYGLSGGHSEEYFSTRPPFYEIIADFTALKVVGNEHDLQVIRDLFGNEFYDMLETAFQQLVKPSLIHEQDTMIELKQISDAKKTQELIEDNVDFVAQENKGMIK